jgi:ADP-ribose pyrophosphatase YjhB (NUDIX family)
VEVGGAYGWVVQVRVTGVLVEGDEILLLDQDAGPERAWSLPGGKVGDEEPLAEALIREMVEETGLVVEVGEMLYVCDHVGPGGPVLHITFRVSRVAGILGDIATNADTTPIRGVAFVPIVDLVSKGFSPTFQRLAAAGFPNAGRYMGPKATIGL